MPVCFLLFGAIISYESTAPAFAVYGTSSPQGSLLLYLQLVINIAKVNK
jgi:hypothetical protein